MENITGQFVNELKNQGKKLLVQYSASWCMPCKILTPKLERIENNYSDVSFVKIDIEQNMEHVTSLGITSVPTVIIYDGEKLIDRSVGIKDEKYYEDLLKLL